MSERVWTRGELPTLLDRALEAAIDKQAKAPVVLRLAELSSLTEWALLISGRSDRHVRGITEGVMQALEAAGARPLGTDGLREHTWDLLDYGEFMIHVFYHPVRLHYDLEAMWRDAPRVALGLPDELHDVSELLGLAPPSPMPAMRGTREFGGFEEEFVDVDWDAVAHRDEDDEAFEDDDADDDEAFEDDEDDDDDDDAFEDDDDDDEAFEDDDADDDAEDDEGALADEDFADDWDGADPRDVAADPPAPPSRATPAGRPARSPPPGAGSLDPPGDEPLFDPDDDAP